MISSAVPSRTFLQCKYKWNASKPAEGRKQFWNSIEDNQLRSLVRKYGSRDWKKISAMLSEVTGISRRGKQCRERWKNSLAPSIMTYLNF